MARLKDTSPLVKFATTSGESKQSDAVVVRESARIDAPVDSN